MIDIVLRPDYTDDQKISEITALTEKDWKESTDKHPSILHAACFNSSVVLFAWLLKQEPQLIHAKSEVGTNVLFYSLKYSNKPLTQYILTLPEAQELENATNNNHATIMHFAALNQDLALFQFFEARHDHKKLYLAVKGDYPLHFAARSASPAVLSYIISHLGFDPNFPTETEGADTPAHCAVEENALANLKVILSLGGKLCFNKNGWHPLHDAAARGFDDIIDYLIDECGVSVNLKLKNSDGMNVLAVAVANNHLETVKKLLRRGASFTFGKAGLHAIHWAAENGHTGMLRFLVLECDIPVDLKTQDNCENTPLDYAVDAGCLDTVIELQRLGAKLSFNKTGWHPIHRAADIGCDKLLRHFVLDCKIDVDLAKNDTNKYTSLTIAIINGHADSVKTLLTLGAPLSFNIWGWHPLHYAAYNNRAEIITTLVVDAKVPVDLLTQDDPPRPPLTLALEKGHLASSKELLRLKAKLIIDKNGLHPLHHAARAGLTEILTDLVLLHEVPINLLSQEGGNCLAYAAAKDRVSTAREALRLGAEFLFDHYGWHPIHEAARANAKAMLSFLVNECQILIDLRTQKEDYPETSLALAIRFKLFGMVKHLHQLGASLTYNLHGLHPLHLAVSSSTKIVKFLVKDCLVSVDLAEDNDDGDTPLHGAAQEGRADIVELLLELGAKYLMNKRKQYPAALAAEKGHISVIRFLMDSSLKMDVNAIVDSMGRTVLYYAVTGEQAELVYWLRSKDADCSMKDKFGLTPHQSAKSSALRAALYHPRLILNSVIQVPAPPVKRSFDIMGGSGESKFDTDYHELDGLLGHHAHQNIYGSLRGAISQAKIIYYHENGHALRHIAKQQLKVAHQAKVDYSEINQAVKELTALMPVLMTWATISKNFLFKSSEGKNLSNADITNFILGFLLPTNKFLKPKDMISLMQPTGFQASNYLSSFSSEQTVDKSYLFSYFNFFQRFERHEAAKHKRKVTEGSSSSISLALTAPASSVALIAEELEIKNDETPMLDIGESLKGEIEEREHQDKKIKQKR